MSKKIRGICLIMASMMIFGSFAGCSNPTASSGEESASSETSAAESEASTSTEAATFDYSAYFDDNGYFKDIKALDYVTLPESLAIEIPADTHVVSDETLQTQIDSILAQNATTEEITDRAVADGDTVNIDYVGKVDGTEFEGGSTEGAGTDVTIGVTQYIDGFLDQLVGHTPGETFDINVTFPDPYENNTDLSGKPAVFTITINYISQSSTPELTDEFVSGIYGSTSYAWTTVDEFRNGLREQLQKNAVSSYILNYLKSNSTVSEIPEAVSKFQTESNVYYYTNQATSYSMDVDDYAAQYGYENLDALMEGIQSSLEDSSKTMLIMQAVAEQQGLALTDEDVTAYFQTNYQTDDYSSFETTYGLPYIKMIVMESKVSTDLSNNAVLLEGAAEAAPAEEQPAEEQPAEEAPAEEQPAAEAPAEEQPAEEAPAE